MSSSGSSSTGSEDNLDELQSLQPEVGVKPGCDLQVPKMTDKGWKDTVHPNRAQVNLPLMPMTVSDTRFEVNPKVMFFRCDRCGKTLEQHSVDMRVDGDYQAPKLALSNRTFRSRWEAGENFMWFCIPCLARTMGVRIEDVWATRG